MRTPSQKDDERRYLMSFLRAARINGSVSLLPDGSGPDFVLETDGHTVGVEITEFWREPPTTGLPRRQIEGIRDQVLRAAERACNAASLPPVEVLVQFQENQTPFKDRVNTLTTELAEAVRKHFPAPGQHRNLGWDFGEDSRLPPEVVGLTVIRRENASESLWLTVDADYVRPVSAEHLQARISAKNGKVQRYVRASPEFWLIVVFDSLRFSGTFDLHSPAFNCVYESVFKRTFVFDTFSGTVRELTTCNPQPAA